MTARLFTLLMALSFSCAQARVLTCVEWMELLGRWPYVTFEPQSLRRENVHGYEARGKANDGMYGGAHGNTPVLVKRIWTRAEGEFSRGIRLSRLLDELKIAQLYSDHGIGPKVLGITKYDGEMGIVFEKIFPSWLARKSGFPGDSTREASAAVTAAIRKKWVGEILKIQAFLSEKRIRASDLQLLLTPTGEVWLMDCGGHYRTTNPADEGANRRDFSEIMAKLAEH